MNLSKDHKGIAADSYDDCLQSKGRGKRVSKGVAAATAAKSRLFQGNDSDIEDIEEFAV